MKNMKKHPVRAVGLALALALMPALLGAQRIGPRDKPPSFGGWCQGAGIVCLFGSAAPCTVTCLTGRPQCRGATCVLGFPTPPTCACV